MMPPQYSKNANTGELSGWAIEFACALGERLGVKPEPVEFPGPDRVMDALKAGACDVGFLPNHSAWTAAVDFSQPFLELDFTLLVPANSAIRNIADADSPQTRIAVVSHHASTLALIGLFKQAMLISAETLEGGFELLRGGQADAFASTRPHLLGDSMRLAGSRVLEERYGVNSLSLVVHKGQAARLAYLNEFVQEAKASGLVHRAIERTGWRGVRVLCR